MIYHVKWNPEVATSVAELAKIVRKITWGYYELGDAVKVARKLISGEVWEENIRLNVVKELGDKFPCTVTDPVEEERARDVARAARMRQIQIDMRDLAKRGANGDVDAAVKLAKLYCEWTVESCIAAG